MPAITQYEANRILDASLAGVAYAASTSYAALMTVKGDASAAGTEVVNASGSGYARQLVAWAAAAAAAKASNAALTYSNMPPATILQLALYDALTAGNRKWYGDLATARTTAAGDSLQIAAGQLTASLA